MNQAMTPANGGDKEAYGGRAQVYSRVFVSDKFGASDLEWLRANNIGFVVNATKDIPNYFEGDGHAIEYCRVLLDDSSEEDLLPSIVQANEFISRSTGKREDDGIPRETHADHRNVLLHCQFGRSRSPALVVAYGMQFEGESLKDAYRRMEKVNPLVNINNSFKRHLMAFEKHLLASAHMAGGASDVKEEAFPNSIDFFDNTLRKGRLSSPLSRRRVDSWGSGAAPNTSAPSSPAGTTVPAGAATYPASAEKPLHSSSSSFSSSGMEANDLLVTGKANKKRSADESATTDASSSAAGAAGLPNTSGGGTHVTVTPAADGSRTTKAPKPTRDADVSAVHQEEEEEGGDQEKMATAIPTNPTPEGAQAELLQGDSKLHPDGPPTDASFSDLMDNIRWDSDPSMDAAAVQTPGGHEHASSAAAAAFMDSLPGLGAEPGPSHGGIPASLAQVFTGDSGTSGGPKEGEAASLPAEVQSLLLKQQQMRAQIEHERQANVASMVRGETPVQGAAASLVGVGVLPLEPGNAAAGKKRRNSSTGAPGADKKTKGNKKNRGSYRCGKCGKMKKGHVCEAETISLVEDARGKCIYVIPETGHYTLGPPTDATQRFKSPPALLLKEEQEYNKLTIDLLDAEHSLLELQVQNADLKQKLQDKTIGTGGVGVHTSVVPVADAEGEQSAVLDAGTVPVRTRSAVTATSAAAASSLHHTAAGLLSGQLNISEDDPMAGFEEALARLSAPKEQDHEALEAAAEKLINGPGLADAIPEISNRASAAPASGNTTAAAHQPVFPAIMDGSASDTPGGAAQLPHQVVDSGASPTPEIARRAPSTEHTVPPVDRGAQEGQGAAFGHDLPADQRPLFVSPRKPTSGSDHEPVEEGGGNPPVSSSDPQYWG